MKLAPKLRCPLLFKKASLKSFSVADYCPQARALKNEFNARGWQRKRWRIGFIFHFSIQFFKFLLGANIHPPERKTTTPTSPPRSTSLVASRRMCQMGSCLLPLVPFLHLCIFAFIRKLRGENPKKASGWGKLKQMAPTLPSLSPRPKSPPPTSTLLPHLPCTSPLVPIMVWWWGMTPMCPFSDFKKMNHVTASFRKKIFQKMDLPLPWFCSTFWKVKIC